ncbi:hypothetical protein GCM10007938_29050 [Vibrio zhanjiangensis]|uniref:DUF2269 family protein n=1 Tax=Vibrio zhanjiangensis TaxID=1046128 RepID=A0ABQ6F0V5_9VIBR|nr:hypothetical protein [Vibrio zhanjiangensis]GLT19123.1 hypothetical protein GCM10007938_29050 [Vibrio zhanjiangensis]
MKSIFKIVHVIALSVFLGTIISYVLIGILSGENNFSFSRDVVLTGTQYLTIPALWIVGFSGIMLSKKSFQGWKKAKIFGFLLIMFNTHFVILPAIKDSIESLNLGDLIALDNALFVEAIAGSINLLLIVLTIIVAVTKWGHSKEKLPLPISE